ncbi:MAG: hypothetical protein IJG09_11905 [Methanobrevibacter sp.]|nr:hypothetical protein [Methanobrevibacter sp.]
MSHVTTSTYFASIYLRIVGNSLKHIFCYGGEEMGLLMFLLGTYSFIVF